MSVALKKINGIESAKASLNQGLVTIELRPGNSVSLEQIRKAITNQGFTPRDAKVTAIGELVPENGKLELKVIGISDVYQVMPMTHSALKGPPRARPVTVEGMVPAEVKGPASIQILSLKETGEKK